MIIGPTIKRTTSADKDFQMLITHLDHELWNELKEDQATYDQFNKVPDISTVLIIYQGQQPVACGCLKEIDANTVEIKRMFVEKEWRGKGLSKLILNELEQWAIEKGFENAILETSIHFTTARQLYESSGYTIIPNYPPYQGLTESVCMKKSF
jgi:putative acetyltransferase